MKHLGPCEVRSCGKRATWTTENDERFCEEHSLDWLLEPPKDDWNDDDGLNEEDFAA